MIQKYAVQIRAGEKMKIPERSGTDGSVCPQRERLRIRKRKGNTEMESRAERAVELHRNGYNCAQAVACTYCGLFGADERDVFRIAEGLGRGMGNMEGTCGAVSAACLLAGLKGCSGNMEKPQGKAATYALSKAIMEGFREKNGTTVCGELKGIGDGKALRACSDCVRDAALLVERILLGEENAE